MEYDVVYAENLDYEGHLVSSYTDFMEGIIYLSSKRTPDAIQLSFLNEIILVCMEQGSMMYRVASEELQAEEVIVRDLTPMLLGVFIDNPEIFPSLVVPIGSSVRIGPRWFEVKEVPMLRDGATIVQGTSFGYGGEISILASLPSKRVLGIFFHELLHACMHMSGLALLTSDNSDNILQPAVLANGLSAYLLMVLQDNEVLRGDTTAS